MNDMTFAIALNSERDHLVRFARKLCGDLDRAEDLAADAIAKGWQHRLSFEIGTSLRAWLSVILRNQFFSEQRRKRFDGGYVDDLHAATAPAQSGAQEDVVRLRDLKVLLALLPAEQRDAILSIALEAEDYEAAAELAGVAVGTIKSRIARGRQALKDLDV